MLPEASENEKEDADHNASFGFHMKMGTTRAPKEALLLAADLQSGCDWQSNSNQA